MFDITLLMLVGAGGISAGGAMLVSSTAAVVVASTALGASLLAAAVAAAAMASTASTAALAATAAWTAAAVVNPGGGGLRWQFGLGRGRGTDDPGDSLCSRGSRGSSGGIQLLSIVRDLNAAVVCTWEAAVDFLLRDGRYAGPGGHMLEVGQGGHETAGLDHD